MKAIFVSLCLVGIISSAKALNCQECSSLLDGNCKDPFTGSYSKECKSGVCSKVKTTGLVDTVTRDCVAFGKDGCTSASVAGNSVETCFCSTDDCNTASGMGASVVAMVMIVTVPYLLFK